MSGALAGVSPARRITRRFGLPFSGYTSSVAAHLCPLDKAHGTDPTVSTAHSRNMMFDPQEGKFYRRGGSAVVGATTGILEDGTGKLTVARARQMISLRSSSLGDGFPTRCVLYTQESATAATNKGCVYLRGTDGGVDYVLGEEFTTTHYPSAADTASKFKVLPYMRTTDGTIGRLNSVALRAMEAVGSRRMMDVGDRLYLPNLTGTPSCWSKTFNETTGDTNDFLRFWHTGLPSPLGMVSADTGTANANGVWQSGDVFFYSVAYRFADGSVSMPIIPRDANPDVNWAGTVGSLMSYFGKVTVDADCDFLTVTRIPIAPEGPNPCIGRYLCRSPKANTGSTDAYPSIFDLRITAYLPNNTQTSFDDYNGNDSALVTDPLTIRFDQIMQPPSRYMGTSDGRVFCGYTKPNPVAIYLCPDNNAHDNHTDIDTNIYEFTLASGVLTLKKDNSAGTAITADNTKTLQYVVDKINNTVSTDSGGKWWACVAPGADPTVLCSATVAVNDNLTSTTGVDTGDTNYAATGRIRSFGSSYYAPIFYSTTYLANYPTEKRRIFFTMGGPGMPTFMGHAWSAANYRTAPQAWGDFMGFGALRNGMVACFSKAIAVLQNRKGGVSGEDLDYRLYELNPSRGCIAWDSIAEFNGAVGYLTGDGYVVTDGQDEIIISKDVWNPASGIGEWSYEIAQSRLAADADSDASHFHAKVMGGKLYCTYRRDSSASNGIPNYMLVYDFSGSAEYAGIRGLLRQDGLAWGWSTPLVLPLSVLGEVVTSAGLARYGTKEDNAGANSNGRIEQFETGTQDNGVAIASTQLWLALDMAESTQKKQAQEFTAFYKCNGSGAKFDFRLDDGGSNAASVLGSGVAVPTTGATGRFNRLKAPLPQNARSQSVGYQARMTDDGAGGALEVWGVEINTLVTSSYT